VIAWLKPVPPAAVAVHPAVIAPVGQSVLQGEEAKNMAEMAENPSTAKAGSYENIHTVMQQHCVVCHSANTIAQKNVKFDTAEEIKQNAQGIYQQVVMLRKMPFGNPGALSDAERASFKQWFESGAPIH
jgi:uncharacterized membrane protein